MDTQTVEVDWREAGKAKRRRRIVEAAARLVRQQGFAAVSMVQIAEAAKLSPATLYNLFKTKGAIFRQVFDLDLEDYKRQLDAIAPANALDRIFTGVDLAATLYERDAAFYRAWVEGRLDTHDGDDAAAVNEPRRRFLQEAVAAAVIQGRLKPDTPSALLGTAMTQLMAGSFLDWATNRITAERLALETSYGFALLLLGHAADDAAAGLQIRLCRLTKALR